jgi:glutathione peroxidase
MPLAKATSQSPKWNFHKYLINRDGNVVGTFPSQVEPLDPKLTGQIEALLTAK